MTAAGRRYAVEGKGYSTAGRITRVGGQADISLDEFLVPMVLASDAVVRDGELIGDPTEGALVVLAAKGGIDAVSTRERYPRIAELPFDAAYKLMATFHKMTGASGHEVIRCFVKGAPDQLLARAATVADADACPAPADGNFRQRYLAENQRLGQQGLRVIAVAQGLRPGGLRPRRRPAPAGHRPGAARPGRHRRPAPSHRQGIDRDGEEGRHPGPDDYRRLRGHRGLGRRHRRHGAHRRRVRRDER